jgi:hypothetical protein
MSDIILFILASCIEYMFKAFYKIIIYNTMMFQ